MTKKQIQRYNDLLAALRHIARNYMTLDQIKKDCSKRGLDYQEYLEMVYENVKEEAREVIRNRAYITLSDRKTEL